MNPVFFAASVIFIIAVVMSMTGRGGGNFYVPVLVAFGLAMHSAATVSQFILFATAAAALLVFHKHGLVDWKLALVIDPPTDIMAFFGGYFAHYFHGSALKFVFALLLVVAGFIMLHPYQEKKRDQKKKFGFWHRRFGEYDYTVNLWLAMPITALTGLVAGMVGISGGSFKIPLMVLACGVPMKVAVGTSSAMVAVTALMGFLGHAAGGDFDPSWAIPLVCAAVLGGLIGGKAALKTKPHNLKKIFAYTTLLAALFMTVNALMS